MSDLLPVLPSIHLISIQPVVGSEAPISAPVRQRSVQSVADLRWLKVEEFLNSSNLSAKSRKVYERELRRFLSWTDQAWFDLKPRHIALYKAYLSEEVRTAQGKPLAKSSINSAIATLKPTFRR